MTISGRQVSKTVMKKRFSEYVSIIAILLQGLTQLHYINVRRPPLVASEKTQLWREWWMPTTPTPMTSPALSLLGGLFNIKPALETGVGLWNKWGFWEQRDLMKDSVLLHDGKCMMQCPTLTTKSMTSIFIYFNFMEGIKIYIKPSTDEWLSAVHEWVPLFLPITFIRWKASWFGYKSSSPVCHSTTQIQQTYNYFLI